MKQNSELPLNANEQDRISYPPPFKRSRKDFFFFAKNQDRITNITIQIDKNSKTPYADLRAELEHARDIAKGEVPVGADVEGSGVHFSRYTGDNEAEVAGGYTYGKSVARAKKNGLIDSEKDTDIQALTVKDFNFCFFYNNF